jgi:hypothetical protein
MKQATPEQIVDFLTGGQGMTDIVERLDFDAARCELQFSKGVAGNIKEAKAQIERLRATVNDQAATITDLLKQLGVR